MPRFSIKGAAKLISNAEGFGVHVRALGYWLLALGQTEKRRETVRSTVSNKNV